MVGLVLVSHSVKVADGLRDMVAQVAGDDVPIATAGGTDDGRLGTSAPRIAAAIRSDFDAGADAILVLLDLGQRGAQPRAGARGAVRGRADVESGSATRRSSKERSSPAVQASIGASLDEVAEAAAGGASMPKLPG